MIASDEVLPNGVKRLNITVPAEKVTKAWEKAIRLEGRSHDFPGFRQGKKASLQIIVRIMAKKEGIMRLPLIFFDNGRDTIYSVAMAGWLMSLILKSRSQMRSSFKG